MLHRNMKPPSQSLRIGLEDILGDLWHARRSGDLGRMALLVYCEVRRWARLADDQGLAEHSLQLVTSCPYADRKTFLAEVDSLIIEAEHALAQMSTAGRQFGLPVDAQGSVEGRR